jgi:hypothetical protein
MSPLSRNSRLMDNFIKKKSCAEFDQNLSSSLTDDNVSRTGRHRLHDNKVYRSTGTEGLDGGVEIAVLFFNLCARWGD